MSRPLCAAFCRDGSGCLRLAGPSGYCWGHAGRVRSADEEARAKRMAALFAKPRGARALSDATICCEDCGGSTFRLTWGGGVYCKTCDADDDGSYGRMAELWVMGEDRGDGPVGPAWASDKEEVRG